MIIMSNCTAMFMVSLLFLVTNIIIMVDTHTHTVFTNAAFSSSAQFFVALGVLTMLYVLGAILVYMLFITPELFMAKWIVIGVSLYHHLYFVLLNRQT